MYIYKIPFTLSEWKDKSYIPKLNEPITLEVKYMDRKRTYHCKLCNKYIYKDDLYFKEYFFNDSSNCDNNLLHFECLK